MERGQPDLTVYTFEVPRDSKRVMDYPDAELWTMDLSEAQAYAQKNGYQLIGNDYVWEDSELVEDYTPEPDCEHCGLPVRERGGLWEDPDYDAGSDEARYCDEAPEHQHQPTTVH